MRSFEPVECRKFSRPDQSCLRRSSSLKLSRSHSATSNPFLRFLLHLPDIDSGRGEGDLEEEDGAIDRMNNIGGNGKCDGFVYKGDPFAHVGRQGGNLRQVVWLDARGGMDMEVSAVFLFCVVKSFDNGKVNTSAMFYSLCFCIFGFQIKLILFLFCLN